jgi:hypothetical protein
MKIEHMPGWGGKGRHCLMHAGGHTFILERSRGELTWLWIGAGYLTQDQMGKIGMSELYDVFQRGDAKGWLSAKIAEIRAKRWAGVS